MIETMSPQLQQLWQTLGFEQATAIQKASFNLLKNKENILGIAPTGSGKTLAYLLPLLENITATQQLQMVILVPSQELAGQVGAVVRQWGEPMEVKCQTIVGGANIKRQVTNLKKQPQIVVGTPGRMSQLVDLKKLKLHNVSKLVIDEADVMLDAEHLSDTLAFIKRLPKSHQTAFFSATYDEGLQQQVNEISSAVQFVKVDSIGENFEQRRKHGYMFVPVRKRSELLRRLAQVEGMQALVFVRTIAEIESLQIKLSYHQIKTGQLHSNLTGQARQQILASFRKGDMVFLFTTDLAARGMDIEGLPYVIQYDLADSAVQYTHRSGRTARMDKQGVVISFVNERSLRELKQQAGPSARLEKYIVHDRQLMSTTEAELNFGSAAGDEAGDFENESAEHTVSESILSKRVAKPKSKKPIPAKVIASKPSHKKKRHLKQKNKGARRIHNSQDM